MKKTFIVLALMPLIVYCDASLAQETVTAGQAKEDIHPGYRPDCTLADEFIASCKNAEFVLFPVIIRTVDTSTGSVALARKFGDSFGSDLTLKIHYDTTSPHLGALQGRGQFEFFEYDMKQLGEFLKERSLNTGYCIIPEILLAPARSEAMAVFGIHVFILTPSGENAFSFLLNAHHNVFADAGLHAEDSDEATKERIMQKSVEVAVRAFKKQLSDARTDRLE